MVLARDPNIPTEVKIAAPILLAIGTGAVLFCVENLVVCSVLGITIDTQTAAIGDFPFMGSGLLGKGGAASAAKGADTIAEGMRVSTHRLTGQGEEFIRYESANPAFTRITTRGGVTRGTYAAPASDGLVPTADRVSIYNLPSPEIARPNAFPLTPPPGTTIVGPRPVAGGTGNEVLFPFGYEP
jgi:hypothetical protein